MLLPGCSTFSPFPVSLDDQAQAVHGEAAARNVPLLNTEDLPIIKLKNLAVLMSRKYQAAMEGDVEGQRGFQAAIIALLAATSGAVLFDANSDLLKGLMLGTGTVYALGTMTMNSERRKIFKAASDAYGCIAARAGALVPAGSLLARYMRGLDALDRHVNGLEQTNTKLETLVAGNATLVGSAVIQSDVKAIKSALSTAHLASYAVRDAVSPIFWSEEEILNDIVSLDRTVSYELSRLEPDYTAFVHSINGTLSTGMGLSTGARENPELTASINTLDGKSQNSADSRRQLAPLSQKDNSPDILDFIRLHNQFWEQLRQFTQQLRQLNAMNVAELVKEGYAHAEKLPRTCWEYSMAVATVAANPVSPELLGTANATETVIISGLRGTPQAKALDETITAVIKPYTGGMAILTMTLADDNGAQDKTAQVLVFDTYGASLILNVTIKAKPAEGGTTAGGT
jgi:hypothetical protein